MDESDFGSFFPYTFQCRDGPNNDRHHHHIERIDQFTNIRTRYHARETIEGAKGITHVEMSFMLFAALKKQRLTN